MSKVTRILDRVQEGDPKANRLPSKKHLSRKRTQRSQRE